MMLVMVRQEVLMPWFSSQGQPENWEGEQLDMHNLEEFAICNLCFTDLLKQSSLFVQSPWYCHGTESGE